MLRVVIDTNVLVSNVLSKTGAPAKVVDAWRAQKFMIATSETAIQELQATLKKLHGTGKYFFPSEDINGLADLLRTNGQIVPALADVKGSILADPDDEKILAIAVGGEASIIISGDKHLLNLKEYQGITIFTPRQFLDQLEQDQSS